MAFLRLRASMIRFTSVRRSYAGHPLIQRSFSAASHDQNDDHRQNEQVKLEAFAARLAVPIHINHIKSPSAVHECNGSHHDERHPGCHESRSKPENPMHIALDCQSRRDGIIIIPLDTKTSRTPKG